MGAEESAGLGFYGGIKRDKILSPLALERKKDVSQSQRTEKSGYR